jgi:hypothetical protein
MQYVVVGMFGSYAEAEDTVQDLELAGIVGEQVEIIGDIDEDARTADTPGEPRTMPRESHHSRLARLFGPGGLLAKPEVRDLSGEMPNYIGEQEFYATHVKQGGAVMVVRAPTDQTANRAAEILRDHGAHTPGRRDPPAAHRVE